MVANTTIGALRLGFDIMERALFQQKPDVLSIVSISKAVYEGQADYVTVTNTDLDQYPIIVIVNWADRSVLRPANLPLIENNNFNFFPGFS